jgi:myosin heavy subunit
MKAAGDDRSTCKAILDASKLEPQSFRLGKSLVLLKREVRFNDSDSTS